MGDINTLTNAEVKALNLVPEVYSRRLYQKAQSLMLWAKFSGPEGSDMPIITKSELLKEEGDTINIIRTLDMVDTAVTGTLKGNEEKMVTQRLQTTPVLKRHGMGWKALVASHITFDKRERAVFLLARRWRKTLDSSLWTTATSTGGGFSATASTIIYGGNATGLGNLDAADIVTPDTIDKARLILEANDVIPVGGDEGYFCMFLHTRAAYYLGMNSDWRTYQSNADIRGLDNWLFKGSKPYGGITCFGYWNGVAIFKTNQCPTTVSTSSPEVTVAKNVCMGAEAMAHTVEAYLDGEGEEIEGIRYLEEVDDYGNDLGVGAAMSFADNVMTSESIVRIYSAANAVT